MQQIHIKNLRLRTVVGVDDWERRSPQDVIVNLSIEFDGSQAIKSDDVKNTVDYHDLQKRLVQEAKRSSFHLLAALAARIVEIVMEDTKVQKVTVEVDKPRALNFCDSVSVSCSARRKG